MTSPTSPADLDPPSGPATNPREARFAAERQAFGLRFRCAACAHVVPSTRACSMGYPNAYLRGPMRALEEGGLPVICKYFELGESELHDDESGPASGQQ